MLRMNGLIFFLGILWLAPGLTGCASDPLALTTSQRTINEVRPLVHADMLMAELLSFTKNIPIMTQGYTRIMLADGDLWIIEGRNEQGTVTVKSWKFEAKSSQ